jgi:hypothetical protein
MLSRACGFRIARPEALPLRHPHKLLIYAPDSATMMIIGAFEV